MCVIPTASTPPSRAKEVVTNGYCVEKSSDMLSRVRHKPLPEMIILPIEHHEHHGVQD